uniref:Protein kinase domain-containing protein n=1 Tax=Panagrolaimus sp. PS1159 TaxID=55785 RepID=A0AC35EZX6_9BILA
MSHDISVALIILLIFNSSYEIKICPVTTYIDAESNCQDCISNCKNCTGPNSSDCNLCIDGFYREEGKGCIEYSSSENDYGDGRLNTMDTSKKIDENYINQNTQGIWQNFNILWVLIIAIIFMTLSFLLMSSLIIWKWNTQNRIFKNGVNFEEGLLKKENRRNKKNYLSREYFSNTFPSYLKERSLLLSFEEKIGGGRFGTVYKCPYVEDGKNIWVAIKKTSSNCGESLREEQVLSRINHINIVQLKGTNHQDSFILVMPLRQGDLKNFLQKEKDIITSDHQIRYCMQISDAMRYLIYKKIVHCDLKASNILVVNINHIEISDFGLSVDLHNSKGDRSLGTDTHIALELFDENVCTCEATDIWSFGVTVWEIVTFCSKIPYCEELKKPKQQITEFKIRQYLMQGERLIIPKNTEPSLEIIMKSCWLLDATQRPKFNQIFLKLAKSLPEGADFVGPNVLNA